jgi:hypothetical protein
LLVAVLVLHDKITSKVQAVMVVAVLDHQAILLDHVLEPQEQPIRAVAVAVVTVMPLIATRAVKVVQDALFCQFQRPNIPEQQPEAQPL